MRPIWAACRAATLHAVLASAPTAARQMAHFLLSLSGEATSAEHLSALPNGADSLRGGGMSEGGPECSGTTTLATRLGTNASC